MDSRQKATKSLILRHKLEEKEALCYISLHLLKSSEYFCVNYSITFRLILYVIK